MHTDEGITGIGESGHYFAMGAIKSIIHEEFRPLLLHKDPLDVEKLWEDMYNYSFLFGRKGSAIIAISGIEIALMDIFGKKVGLPVYKLLGGEFRRRIKAYASGGFRKSKENLVEEMSRHVKNGFTAVKMKVGFDEDSDVENVRSVRSAIGSNVDLIVDANMGYTAKQAIRFSSAVEACNVLWFEEPVSADDVSSLVEVTKSISIQTAAGENEYTARGFNTLISNRAVDIVQPDVTRSGGLTECKKIASMAHLSNMLCTPHSWGNTIGLVATAHLLAAVPNGYMLEFDQTENPLREELLRKPFRLRDGVIEIPQSPGLGIELDEDTISRYKI